MTTPWRGWGLAAYGLCGALALLVGWTLFHVPFQLSDNVANMLQLQESSLAAQVWANLTGGSYVRPFLWGALKVAWQASGGHYFVTFRALQAAQLLLLVWLFVRVLGVRSPATFAVAPLGTVMLLGFPTFRGLVIEAFPINTYLTVAVCAMAAINLTVSRPSWLTDVAAVALFLYAVLSVENGILLWPCYVVARVVGLRGVSWRGVAATTAAVALYLAHRALFLTGATPGLSERPSGFGFAVMEPQDLLARFSDNPLPFYAYNVVTSPLSVLFAEPRRGVFHLTGQWLAGAFWPGSVITVAVVTATTIVMFAGVALRIRGWRSRGLAHADRLVAVFVSVLAANAVVSFAYQKDEIMSVAGLFYVVAATVSLQALAAWFTQARRPAVPVLAASALMLLLGVGWSARYLDLFYHMNLAAVRNQADWVFVDTWKRANRIDERYPESGPLIEALRRQAVAMSVPNPAAAHRGWERYSDTR